MRTLRSILCLSLFILAGCTIPLRRQFVNDDLFPTPKVFADHLLAMRTIVASGRTDLDREVIFRTLTPNPDQWRDLAARCKEMLPEDIQRVLYPNAQVLGPVIELQKHAEEMRHFSGCSFDVRHLERSSIIGMPYYTVYTKGHDQKLILIFEERGNGSPAPQTEAAVRRVRAFTEGRAKVDERELIYYWDVGLDVLQGFIVEGGKNAGKSLF